MKMMETFDEAWAPLESELARLAAKVAAVNPNAFSRLGHYATEYFPFRGYVSFNRSGRPGFEDLVVMISVEHSKGRFLWSTDITMGDDAVWVYGQEFEFDESENLSSWLTPAVTGALTFIQKHEDFIIAEIGSIGRAVSSS